MAAGQNQSPKFNPEALLASIVGGLMLFALFAGVTGCFQSLDVGVINPLGQETSTFKNACSLGFLSFSIGVAGWFLGIFGVLFDYTLLYTVVLMSQIIGPGSAIGGAIQIAWVVIRDLINLVFIGALVYAAISLILQTAQNISRLIVSVIIAALLINFSYLFAGVIVDASNFISAKIYEEAIYSGAQTTPSLSLDLVQQADFAQNAPVSATFQAITRLNTLYDLNQIDFSEGGVFASNSFYPFIVGILGSILFTVTAGVFLVASIFLVIRFAVIILLLITSPIGILYFLNISKLSKYGKAWWDTLIAQALFPIVFLLMITTSFKVLEAGFSQNNATFTNVIFNPTTTSNFFLFLTFMLAIVLVHFSIKVASNVAQQKEFVAPTPAKLFAGAEGFGKAARYLNPRLLTRTVGETIVGGGIGGALRDDAARTFARGTYADKWTPALKDAYKEADAQLGRIPGVSLIPGEDFQTRQAQKAAKARSAEALNSVLRKYKGQPTKATEENDQKAIHNWTETRNAQQIADFIRGKSAEDRERVIEVLAPEKQEEVREALKNKPGSSGSSDQKQNADQPSAQGGGAPAQGGTQTTASARDATTRRTDQQRGQQQPREGGAQTQPPFIQQAQTAPQTSDDALRAIQNELSNLRADERRVWFRENKNDVIERANDARFARELKSSLRNLGSEIDPEIVINSDNIAEQMTAVDINAIASQPDVTTQQLAQIETQMRRLGKNDMMNSVRNGMMGFRFDGTSGNQL